LVPLRIANGCHGLTLVRQGTELASHCSETGLSIVGVPSEISRFAPSLLIRSAATCPAREVSDWESAVTILTLYSLSPALIGWSLKYAVICLTT
jgi:hypothetical protein